MRRNERLELDRECEAERLELGGAGDLGGRESAADRFRESAYGLATKYHWRFSRGGIAPHAAKGPHRPDSANEIMAIVLK